MTPGSVGDRMIAGAVAGGMMLIVWASWRHMPHPARSGGAIMAVVVALTMTALFSRSRRGRMIWPRMAALAGVVLTALLILQMAAAAGYVV